MADPAGNLRRRPRPYHSRSRPDGGPFTPSDQGKQRNPQTPCVAPGRRCYGARTSSRRSGAVDSSGSRPCGGDQPGWWAAGSATGDCTATWSFPHLWTSCGRPPTRRNAPSERGTAVVGRVRRHPAGPSLRTGVAHELRGGPGGAARGRRPHPRRARRSWPRSGSRAATCPSSATPSPRSAPPTCELALEIAPSEPEPQWTRGPAHRGAARRRRRRSGARHQPSVHLRHLRDRPVQPVRPRRRAGGRRDARPASTTRCSSTATPAWARPTSCRPSATTSGRTTPRTGCATSPPRRS